MASIASSESGGSEYDSAHESHVDSAEEEEEEEDPEEEDEASASSQSSDSQMSDLRFRGLEEHSQPSHSVEASDDDDEMEADNVPLVCCVGHRMEIGCGAPAERHECSVGCGCVLDEQTLRWFCEQCGDYDVCLSCADTHTRASDETSALEQEVEAARVAFGQPGFNLHSHLQQAREARAAQPLPRDALFRDFQRERAAERAAEYAAERAAGMHGSESLSSSGSSAEGSGSPASRSPAFGSPASRSAASSTEHTPSTIGLSPPPAPSLHVARTSAELREQVRELMDRDASGAVRLAREIFRRLPTRDLALECERLYGEISQGLEAVETNPLGRRRVDSSTAVGGAAPRSFAVDFRAGLATRPMHFGDYCRCCDQMLGDGTSGCTALLLLHSLRDHLEDRDAIVARELEEGFDEAMTHRAARWYIYRQFVAAQYGHLGKGVRVKLPACVVAAIRARYRAPGCTCTSIEALANCAEHGYVGFRER